MQKSQAKFWIIPVERHNAGAEKENLFYNYQKFCARCTLVWKSFGLGVICSPDSQLKTFIAVACEEM